MRKIFVWCVQPITLTQTTHGFDSVFNNIDRCGTTHQDFSCMPCLFIGCCGWAFDPWQWCWWHCWCCHRCGCGWCEQQMMLGGCPCATAHPLAQPNPASEASQSVRAARPPSTHTFLLGGCSIRLGLFFFFPWNRWSSSSFFLWDDKSCVTKVDKIVSSFFYSHWVTTEMIRREEDGEEKYSFKITEK